jgi:hypothetical protein
MMKILAKIHSFNVKMMFKHDQKLADLSSRPLAFVLIIHDTI